MLRGLKPKVFVAENVSGLVKGTAKGYFLEILAALKASGYRVTCRVLDAQWLGVPQQRQRTIFVGVREDLKLEPAHPEPLPYWYSVRDALPWVLANGTGPSFQQWKSMKRDPLNTFQKSELAPSQSILASGVSQGVGMCGDQHGTRKFTIDELKRICGFPDDFILKGTYAQQWERLGNSVPPVMMSHIAKTIRDKILNGTQ
jgi:DNA (cytosine-5)-methyltransferase 1